MNHGPPPRPSPRPRGDPRTCVCARDGRRGALAVKRKDEEEAVARGVLVQVVPSHPRIVAFSGSAGVYATVACAISPWRGPTASVSMATAGLRRLDLCMIAVFSREQVFAHTQHTIDAASLHHLVGISRQRERMGSCWRQRGSGRGRVPAGRSFAPLRCSLAPVLLAVDAR
ncbi:hypothetical_protein [Leishmania major strain Friedlin]|nr:hypothetical_protein [Leishmania major strain Friedlin]